MSRIHLRSNTLVLWLSLSAAVAASAAGVGCSSSTDSGGGASAAGKSNSGATAGSGNSEAGEPAVGDEPGDTGENGEGGSQDSPVVGTGGTSNGVAGGPSKGGEAGEPGDPGTPGEGGAAGSAEGLDPEVVAAQARAKTLIASLGKERTCTYCHDVSYSGGGFYRNITPDVATGIGSWTADEIKTAIHDGMDKDGKTLCKTMERYTFTDDQLTDIVIFLQHLKPISKKTTATCK